SENFTAVLVPVVAASAACFAGAGIAPAGLLSLALTGAGAGLAGLAAILKVRELAADRARKSRFAAISEFVERDASATMATDGDGVVVYQNKASIERFGEKPDSSLIGLLDTLFASPGALVSRLQTKAQAIGAAREDVVTRRGHVRLSAHRVLGDGYLWRLEEIADRTGVGRGADGISVPMMTVSKSGTVLFMNEALRRLIGGRETSLDRIVNDLPLRPGGIHEIAAIDGPVECQMFEISSAAGRRELYMLPAPEARNVSDREFLDVLPVAMLKIDETGRIVSGNAGARNLLGEQVGGQMLSDVLEGLGRSVAEWMADAIQGHGLNRPEVVRARRADHETFVQTTLCRADAADDAALFAVLQDATELKTLEAQFVQSQKMQAIGQLAGGVAHDFNNLLTAISGHCDLLLLAHDEGDPDYSDLVQIRQNANRAASLVGQLLAFSRKQNLTPQLIDMRDAMGELGHLLNRLVGEKVSLSVRHDPALKLIRADRRQLEQVILNLVVNSRDAMAEGGAITIETELQSFSEPFARQNAAVPAGQYVVITVADEGTGIPAEDLPKIFEPFFTTKRTGEGTGLGLSTAYGIVKQSGGFIFADSVEGQGTTFSLFFPAQEALPETETAPVDAAPRKALSIGQGVVLLVEDEAPVRAFASRALRMRGYTVIEAESAEDALETLKDDDLKVDVFVTDVIMPGRDGPSWVREALETRPDARVVFVSGYAEDSIRNSGKKVPNSTFLPKPFTLADLTETVHRQLH
ncbi:MAG: response regulator, partial [Rhodobacteraceae bacterium]|nr:response regulator [Paracoccaceae bacterium]